jgi:undecaprenyl-diphosphatase
VDVTELFSTLSVHLSRAGLLLTALGLAFGGLTWLPGGLALDRGVFHFINRRANHPVLDWLMWSITHLGSVWAGLVALTVALLRHYTRFGVLTALALLSLGILIGVSKALTQRPRPYTQLGGVRVVGLKPADLSYPSGHAATAFALATLLAFGLPLGPSGRLAVYGLACSVGYSRVHLGVHYPSDVLAGTAMGVGWGMVWVAFIVH